MIEPFFAVIKAFFPFRPTEAERKRLQELDDTYKAFLPFELIPFLLFSGIAWYLWYRVLLAAEGLRLRSLDPGVFLVVPTIYYWAGLSLFLGMISSAPLLRLVYKVILRSQYPDYVLYVNMRAGFDTWKMVGYLAVLVTVPALVFAFLGIDTYSRVTEQEIVINRFWTMHEQRYPYAQVKAIKSVSQFRAMNGKLVERPHFAIEFIDGTRWTTRDGMRDPEPETDAKMIEFISAKSGKKIQDMKLDEP